MSDHEFQRPFAVDLAPRGRKCEWCGKPAEQHVTAIGGICHNSNGFFCRGCSEQYMQAVMASQRIQSEALRTATLHQ